MLTGLGAHIRNLDDGIGRFMNPQGKQASNAIQDVAGIGGTSAQAILSVIGTDMGRFPSGRHISSWAGLCPGNNESVLKDGVIFKDLGADYYNQFHKERKINAYLKK